MDRLIDFVFNNIHFIVIVVGIIYAMFFRKSPLEKNPPGRMPDFGGGSGRPRQMQPPRPRPQPQQPPRQAREETAGHRPPPAPPLERAPAAVPAEPPRQPAAFPAASEAPRAPERQAEPAAISDALPAKEVLRDRPAAAALKAAASASMAQRQEGVPGNRPELSREELKRAIVWSEILGQPRSRKAYRR
ncbi:hypothetical protein [Cohnella algarum]|uniref:hypothetical protein n=1 Tax=Cohnella algarum TaxID=2044859 RepID=UPI001968606D|nr:hypothetical protein [Cohnella algarum]MBN2983306.1 hypothetical protein [Cohnella algarum]